MSKFSSFTYTINQLKAQPIKSKISSNVLLSTFLVNTATSSSMYLNSITRFEKTLRFLKRFQRRLRKTQKDIYLVNFPDTLEQTFGALYQIEALNVRVLAHFLKLRLFRRLAFVTEAKSYNQHLMASLANCRKDHILLTPHNPVLLFLTKNLKVKKQCYFLSKILKKKKWYLIRQHLFHFQFFKNFRSLKFLVSPWFPGRLTNRRFYAKTQVPQLYKKRYHIPKLLLFYSDFDRLANVEFAAFPFFSLDLPKVSLLFTSKFQSFILMLLFNSWRLTLFSRNNLQQILSIYKLLSSFMVQTKRSRFELLI